MHYYEERAAGARTRPTGSADGTRHLVDITHGYSWHDTTKLVAVLGVAYGAVLAQCKPKYLHQNFLAFRPGIGGGRFASVDDRT